MTGLLAADILHIWEVGITRHPVDQGLLILAIAFPQRSPQQLAWLSVGQRDELLMAVRQQTFGYQLNSVAHCPACKRQLEFCLDLRQFLSQTAQPPWQEVQQLHLEEWQLQFRLCNSLDLAAIAHCQEVSTARNLLLQRCIIKASYQEVEVAVDNLPDMIINALANRMTECNSCSDIQLNLTCPDCGHDFAIVFDILAFFWIEIAAQAKRLLREVDALARVYGWSEADILAMSATRRQLYLEMLT